MSSAHWPCLRRPGPQGPGRTGCLRELGGGTRPPPRGSTGPVDDLVRLAPLTHYGAFKVCNELNARVYWLDHGITSVGLRPWTVYGVGRDFGMTSEPTKAIKAAALGRPYRISYGGRQDLQYVADVAATFVRALTQPFEGADAFNLRGTVVSIEEFVQALCDRVPEARSLVTHGDRQLPIAPIWTIAGWTAGSGQFRARLWERALPTPTAGSSSSATSGGSMIRIWHSRRRGGQLNGTACPGGDRHR